METKLGYGDDWCDQEDTVPDGDRIYRCSKCRKRLHPRKILGQEGEVTGFRLPRTRKRATRSKPLKPGSGR